MRTLFARRRSVHVLLGVFLGAGPWLAPNAPAGGEFPPGKEAGAGKDAVATKAPFPLEAEQPDDPPGAYVARDNPFARSPSLAISFGPYQSIQVNVDALGRNILGDAANEPSIAVNPTNPLNMVIGWRQFDTVTSNFRQAGWAYTFDGGQTWTFPGVLQPGVFRTDPVLDADSQGNFYYQSLTGNFLVDVFRSTNGGVSWLPPVAEFGGDKNWLAVDRSGGPSDGHIYGIWQRFFACCESNVLTRSTNGGASYESPVPVTNSPTFGTLAVGPNGELYAAGIDGSTNQDVNHFVVATSTNASNPAATPIFTGGRVSLGGRMRHNAGPNPAGLLGQANVAVDGSSGAARGNVYVSASVDPSATGDPLDASFIRSDDAGDLWSSPVRVNDDPSQANWQWFATHSVSPNGRIDMIWNDTRNTGQVNLSQLFYAYSWNGGVSWSPNVAVSPIFNSFVGFPQQNKIGDYYTIVSNDSGADVAYAATFNGEQDVYYLRVFPDCNGNGVSDVIDIAGASSLDCDGNHLPDECQVDPICGPSLVYASNSAADSCPGGGGGNGSADPGEDVVMAVTLRNDGTVNLTDVSAALSTDTPGVTVTRASAAYPDIPAQGLASSSPPHFAFTIGTGVPCGAAVDFTLVATANQGSWTRAFTVPVGLEGTATTTHDSTDVPKAIPDEASVTSNLNVAATAGVPDVDMGVTLTHTFDADRVLTLIAPNAAQVVLADGRGVSGDNYTGTVFDDEAAAHISSGSPPFTGRFGPEQTLSALDGIPANGAWRLEVQDLYRGDTGTLTAWSVTLTLPGGSMCAGCAVSTPSQGPAMLAWSPGSQSSLQWESIPGASFFNVYRGVPADLPSLLNPAVDSCRRHTTTANLTGSVLAEAPPPGSLYWYLVRAANGAGQGPAGNATAGPRSQESSGACP